VRVLVVNAGSSSLKVDIVEDGEAVESRDGCLPSRLMWTPSGTASCMAGRTSSNPW
jgi:acetate kinase